MRTHTRNIIVTGLGLVTALAMAACSPDDTTAKPGTDTKSATAAPTECTNTDNRADDEPINVRNELVGCKDLVVVTVVERNASYILAPFQRPLVMSSDPVPGNKTCTFRMVRADYKGGALAKHTIKSGSEVKLTGHVVGNDAREGAELKPGPVTVNFKDLNRDWLVNKAGFDLRVCGSLEQK